MTHAPNPFEVLRLDPTAMEEEIVRQAGRLRQRAPDETALNSLRQAVQALTARPEERRLLALLTHPRPGHSSPALDRFVAAFRRAPVPEATTAPCPELDLDELRELLRAALAEESKPTPVPFEPLPTTIDPEEVRRQAAEATWQSLLADMRA
jgi:hypothetical protein